MRLKSLRWSSSEGGAKVSGILLTLGLRMTWRSKPIKAALGLPISLGTWQTTSEFASLRQESRQPSASSSFGEYPAVSRGGPVVAVQNADLAFAACSLGAAGAIDGQTDPISGVKDGHSGGDPGHFVVGTKLDGDLLRARRRSGCHWSKRGCVSV